MTYEEKRELAYRYYEQSLDLDLAFDLLELSEADRDKLVDDSELRTRIMVLDAKNKSELIRDLRHLASRALNEGVRLNALKELGKTYYPKRFDPANKQPGDKSNAVRVEMMKYDETL